MEYEDRYVTTTPEGVSLDSVLAGLGSRFAAYLIDVVIQSAALLGIILVGLLIGGPVRSGRAGSLILNGALYLFVVLDFLGYFVVCEMLWSGRTPGKRALGLRVVRVGGQPVGFWSSLLRNLLRVVDLLPSIYIVGAVLILVTPKNQRLGDVLGHTVVVREKVAADRASGPAWMTAGGFAERPGGARVGPAPPPWAAGAAWSGQGWLPPELAHWDVSGVPAEELALARTFVNNRGGYSPAARSRLAYDIASRIWPYVAGPAGAPPPEQFLEAVLMVKAARG